MINLSEITNSVASAVGMGASSAPRRKTKVSRVKAAKKLLSGMGMKAVRKYSAPARRRASRPAKRRRY